MATVVRRLADRVRHLRNERHLSQAALAKKSKLSTSFIANIESAARIPTLVSVERLANGLGVELAYLLDFRDGDDKGDRLNDEIQILNRLLRSRDAAFVRKVRKAVEVIIAG